MAEKQNKNALATTGPNDLMKIEGVVAERPDEVKVGDRTGTENITRDDMQMPRLGIAQSLSPERDESDPKFIEGLIEGNMFNNLTKQIYGNGPVPFIIVRSDRPRWVEFVPRELGGGVKDPNVPANDPRTAFQADGKPPIATKFYDFVIMLLPSREIVSVSFKGTGLKIARQLNALIAMRGTAVFTGVYALSTIMTKNAKGRFAIPQVKNAGFASGELLDYAKKTFAAVADKAIKFEEELPADADTFDAEVLERESVAAQTGNVQGM